MGNAANLMRDCTKCGNPVHVLSKACKLCGEPSPWDKSAAPAAGSSTSPAFVGGPAGLTPEKPASASEPQGAIRVPPAQESAPAASPPQAVAMPRVVVADPGEAGKQVAQISNPGAVAVHRTGPVAFEPHVVMQPFTHQFGDVLGVFKAGDVVSDFQTVTKLKAAGQPITPASSVDNVACCPGCGKVFVPTRIPRGRVA